MNALDHQLLAAARAGDPERGRCDAGAAGR